MAKTVSKAFSMGRVIQDIDLNSFIDIIFKHSSVTNVTEETIVGFKDGEDYTVSIDIDSQVIDISIPGSSSLTIGGLVKLLQDAIDVNGTVSFIEIDKVKMIRISASNPGLVPISVPNLGNLTQSMIGTKLATFETSFGIPCVGSGVNFLTIGNTTVIEPLECLYVVQARNSSGVSIPVISFFDSQTGTLQVKPETGSFSNGDSVSINANLV